MPLFGRSHAQVEKTASATVICPSCHEPAPAEGLVCPHCKGVLPPRPQAADVGSTRSDVAMASASAGQASQETEQTASTAPTASSSAWCPQCGGEFGDAEALRRHGELAHATR